MNHNLSFKENVMRVILKFRVKFQNLLPRDLSPSKSPYLFIGIIVRKSVWVNMVEDSLKNDHKSENFKQG